MEDGFWTNLSTKAGYLRAQTSILTKDSAPVDRLFQSWPQPHGFSSRYTGSVVLTHCSWAIWSTSSLVSQPQVGSDPFDSMSELVFQSFSFSSVFFKINELIWGLCWVFTAVWVFSSCREQGYSLCSGQASHCSGFSCCELEGFRRSPASAAVVRSL